MECIMPKISSPDRANTDKRAADRFFWFTVLGAVLATPITFWLFRAIGMSDSMQGFDVVMMPVCLLALLAFMFTHRKADGTIQWARPPAKATSAPKPPQGRKTLFLLATIFALNWLLVNVLHLSGGVLALVQIVSGAATAVLCARYVIRSQKPQAGID
jgi:Na+/melibiose symporter-like transporter